MSRVPWIVLVLLFATRVVATFAPTPWMWGLDALANAPPALQATSLALFSLALVPRWMRSVERRVRVRSILLVSISSLVLIALLPCGHALLGDSRTYLSSLERGVRAAGAAHREVLPQAIVEGTYRLLGGRLGAAGCFRLVDLILGVVAVGAGLSLSRKLAGADGERLAILATALMGGGMLLFASYAEFYAFAVAGALLFACAGITVLRDRGPFWLAALAFAFAGLCHAQFVFAAPALLHLARESIRRGRRGSTWMALLGLPALVIGTLAALRYPFAELPSQFLRGGTFLPPLSRATTTTAYSVWSGWHWVELLNVALLVSPAAAALVPASFLRPAGAAPEDRGRRELQFLFLLALGPACFAVVANPALGMIRDWDIFVLPVTLLALFVAARGAARVRGDGVLAAVVITNLLHGAVWLGVNHSADQSAARIRRVAAARQFFGAATHAELWRYLGSADAQAGRYDDAVESFLRSIGSDPDDRMSYRLLATTCLSRSRAPAETSLDGYQRALATVPHREAYGQHGAALALVLAGRPDLALIAAEESVSLEPNHPELLAMLGDLLRREGRIEEALTAYARALDLDPWQPRAYVGRACLRALSGDVLGAREAMRAFLKNSPWSTQAQQFQHLLESPQGAAPEALRSYLYVR